VGVTAVFSNLAFIGLVVIFISRARNAAAVPAARLSWLASGVGSLALFSRGYVVPLPVLDGLLGGTNLINLAQNIFATIAFWLVMQAVRTRNRRPLGELAWWPLVLIILAFSIAFFFIDRGSTTRDFIRQESGQVALWLYASIYMAGIAGMCAYLVGGVRGRHSKIYMFFIVGGAMVAIGSVMEIVFLTLQCFALATPELRQFVYGLFDPFFYPGVVLVTCGIAIFSLKRSIRHGKVRRQVSSLEILAAEHGLAVSPGSSAQVRGRAAADAALERLYELVILLHDYDHAGQVTLDVDGRRQLHVADEIIADQLLDTSFSRGVPLLGALHRDNTE
jgi:hypothetical protein